MKIAKTNAMRMLDKAKVNYELREYPLKGLDAAVDVPTLLGITRSQLFKTLVTTDTAHNYFVFVIPSAEELDLKKAARVAGVKRIEMLPQRDLFKLTGYIHGGCSPVGMKKLFPTFMDAQLDRWEWVVMSAGKVGMLMQVDPRDIVRVVNATVADLVKAQP